MLYDLEERTKLFSKDVIELLIKVNKNIINESIIRQLIKSATSVGANYCEANGATSRKDFKKIKYICAEKKFKKLSIG